MIQDIPAPVAKKIPKELSLHNDTRIDNYFWMRLSDEQKNAENPDPRTTDDHFLMEISVHDNEKQLKTLLTKTGAVEVHVIEKEAH